MHFMNLPPPNRQPSRANNNTELRAIYARGQLSLEELAASSGMPASEGDSDRFEAAAKLARNVCLQTHHSPAITQSHRTNSKVSTWCLASCAWTSMQTPRLVSMARRGDSVFVAKCAVAHACALVLGHEQIAAVIRSKVFIFVSMSLVFINTVFLCIDHAFQPKALDVSWVDLVLFVVCRSVQHPLCTTPALPSRTPCASATSSLSRSLPWSWHVSNPCRHTLVSCQILFSPLPLFHPHPPTPPAIQTVGTGREPVLLLQAQHL